MVLFLKQSTAVTVKVGPAVDSSDGNTEETATISDDQWHLHKNGAGCASKHDTTDATHDDDGYFYVVLDDTDTGTLGDLLITCHPSGVLPLEKQCMVITANAWDTLFGSDRFQVDVRELGDANLALTTQMKADVNTEIDGALDTAIPGSPTANSVNERVKTLDDLVSSSKIAAQIKGTDDIDFSATQKTSLNAATPTVTVGTNNDKTGYRLSTTGIDDILDEVVETLTLREIQKILLSAIAGKSGGGGTGTITFQDYADSKARITATVDANKNRTAITLDAT